METPADVMHRFGRAVRRARERKRLTQEQLATDADVDRRTIARIERGDYNARLRVVAQVAHALGLRARDVL